MHACMHLFVHLCACVHVHACVGALLFSGAAKTLLLTVIILYTESLRLQGGQQLMKILKILDFFLNLYLLLKNP